MIEAKAKVNDEDNICLEPILRPTSQLTVAHNDLKQVLEIWKYQDMIFLAIMFVVFILFFPAHQAMNLKPFYFVVF